MDAPAAGAAGRVDVERHGALQQRGDDGRIDAHRDHGSGEDQEAASGAPTVRRRARNPCSQPFVAAASAARNKNATPQNAAPPLLLVAQKHSNHPSFY